MQARDAVNLHLMGLMTVFGVTISLPFLRHKNVIWTSFPRRGFHSKKHKQKQNVLKEREGRGKVVRAMGKVFHLCFPIPSPSPHSLPFNSAEWQSGGYSESFRGP